MVATDFEFDGIKASDKYNLMICNITGGSEDSILAGAPLTLHTVPVRHGSFNYLASTSYDTVLETTFQVMKFSCEDGDFKPLTIDEKRDIMRWLNRKEYCITKFYHDETKVKSYQVIEIVPVEKTEINEETGEEETIIIDEEVEVTKYKDISYKEYDGVYYEGTFDSISEIYVSGLCVGLELHFITNRPYGFRQFESEKYNIDTEEYDTFYGVDESLIDTIHLSANEEFIFEDYSDEVGYIYPKEFTIICKQSGDYVITNKLENRKTIIKNCSSNERITFTDELTFTTSNDGHKVQNDFNYVFFRVANKYNDKINVIESNYDCDIIIKYDPIIKGVGI